MSPETVAANEWLAMQWMTADTKNSIGNTWRYINLVSMSDRVASIYLRRECSNAQERMLFTNRNTQVSRDFILFKYYFSLGCLFHIVSAS